MTSHARWSPGDGEDLRRGSKRTRGGPRAGGCAPNAVSSKWGQLITVDGTTGRVLLGAAKLVEPKLAATSQADGVGGRKPRLRVRANADNPSRRAAGSESGSAGGDSGRPPRAFSKSRRSRSCAKIRWPDAAAAPSRSQQLPIPASRRWGAGVGAHPQPAVFVRPRHQLGEWLPSFGPPAWGAEQHPRSPVYGDELTPFETRPLARSRPAAGVHLDVLRSHDASLPHPRATTAAWLVMPRARGDHGLRATIPWKSFGGGLRAG